MHAMATRRIVAAALAAAVLLVAAVVACVQSASAGPERVAAALQIAEKTWGPVCGGATVTVTRGKLPRGRLAQAYYRYPPGAAEDPTRYYDCKITLGRGHVPWRVFCTAIEHEDGHLAGWRAQPGQEFVRADGTRDAMHSNDPRNIMFPRQEHTFESCRSQPPAAPASAATAPTGALAASRSAVTVLLLPGGGWQHADPETMDPWVRDFREHDIRARAISYPLRNVLAAIAAVRDVAAAEHGPVVLYGISAGGTIAAAIAAIGDVAGAVNIAGPTDFTRWIGPGADRIMRQIQMTAADKRAASPYWRLNGRQAPQLIQCGLADPLVTYEQCHRYLVAARRGNPDTQLQPMANAHAQWPADMRAARQWITDRWPTSVAP